MVRTVVIPEDTHIEFDIPADYVGKEVQVTYSLLEEATAGTSKKTMADFWGILSDKTANEMQAEIIKSRGEWDRNICCNFI
jgi:hypothetical protein